MLRAARGRPQASLDHRRKIERGTKQCRRFPKGAKVGRRCLPGIILAWFGIETLYRIPSLIATEIEHQVPLEVAKQTAIKAVAETKTKIDNLASEAQENANVVAADKVKAEDVANNLKRSTTAFKTELFRAKA